MQQAPDLLPISTSSESVMESLNWGPFSAVGGGGGARGSECWEGLPGHCKLSASLALSSLAVGSSQTICSLWDGSVLMSITASLETLKSGQNEVKTCEPHKNWNICLITLWTLGKMNLPLSFKQSEHKLSSNYMASLPQSFQGTSVPTASNPAPNRCVGSRVGPSWSHPAEPDGGTPPCRHLGGWHDLLELSLQVLSHF